MLSMPEYGLIEACEQRLVNLWPSAGLMLMEKWALRFANGYSGRANSASALWRGADLTTTEIALIAARYTAAGLPPAIRLSPLAAADLPARLLGLGWILRHHSTGMIANVLPHRQADERVSFTDNATDEWLTGVSALQPDQTKANPVHLGVIVRAIRTGAGFATLTEAGRPVGFGLVAHDRGYAEIGSIILAPDVRGKGLGRVLVSSLLAHAFQLGASRVFLQVETGNTAAETLYASLGFAPLYVYGEYRLTAAR